MSVSCQQRKSSQPHSITSSASASKVRGTAMPSALAALRLITKVNLLACSIGRSPGFTPRRYSEMKELYRRADQCGVSRPDRDRHDQAGVRSRQGARHTGQDRPAQSVKARGPTRWDCFLPATRRSYVNGQAIPVDGGLTASMPYCGEADLILGAPSLERSSCPAKALEAEERHDHRHAAAIGFISLRT